MYASAVLVALLLSSFASAAPLQARGGEEAPRVLLVPASGMDTRALDRLYAGLHEAGLAPVGREERAGVDLPIDEAIAAGDRARAAALVREARAAYRALELDATRTAVDTSIAEVLRSPAPEASFDVLADALLIEASLALAGGDADAAGRALLLLVRVQPERAALDPGEHPPSLVEAFTTARALEPTLPAAELVVDARAVGFAATEVLVDGARWRSGTPLRSGPHIVTVAATTDVAPAASRTTRAFRVDLDAASSTSLASFLAPADASEQRSRHVAASALEPSVEAAAALARGTAAHVVVDLRPLSPVMFVAARPELGLVELATDGGEGVGGPTLGRVIAARLASLPPVVAEDRGSVDGGLSATIVEDDGALPWILAGAGVVVVGSAVALVVWLTWPETPPTGPRPVIVSCCVR
jgi:hypothetical protein